MDRPTRPQDIDQVHLEAGDPSARFRALFDRDYAYVWHSLRRLGVFESDCDDVANEVFVRVHERFEDYDPTRPARPWLFAFCARFASDYRRLARHRRERLMESGDMPPDATFHPENDALGRERTSIVHRALDALDDEVHEKRFPRGALAEERDVLRVQALATKGDLTRARTAADAFRKKYPASPFLPAVESRLSPP